MATIFRFRMISDLVDDFIRDYEVPAESDLQDLHDYICGDLEYDASGFSSFFTAGDNWQKLQEYTLVDMQDEDSGAVSLPMRGTILKDLIVEDGGKLIFMFDVFAARSFYLELSRSMEAETSVRYPRVGTSEGDPPRQFDTESLISDDSPFNDAMSEFMDYDGAEDENYGEEF